MKYQALFSSNDESRKLKCRLLQFLFDTLRVKSPKKRQQNLHLQKLEMERLVGKQC